VPLGFVFRPASRDCHTNSAAQLDEGFVLAIVRRRSEMLAYLQGVEWIAGVGGSRPAKPGLR
jgi:hypothetical protein